MTPLSGAGPLIEGRNASAGDRLDAPPGAGRERLRTLLPAVVAVIAYGWTLALPFQLDDYTQIPGAEGQLRFVGLAVESVFTGEDRPPAPGAYLFRPLLWASFVGELALGGGFAVPPLFHAVSVLLHALASALLYRLIRRWWSPGPALVGALFFAASPAGSQAVSWIAARGDVLATVCALAGMLAVTGTAFDRRPRRQAVWAGVWLAGACLAKLSGFTFVPVVLAAVLLSRRRAPIIRRIQLAAWTSLPVALVFLLRWAYLETPRPVYAEGMILGFDAFPRMIDALPGLVAHLAVPWNRSPELAACAPVLAGLGIGRHSLTEPASHAVVSCVLLAALCLSALMAPLRTLRRAVPVFAAFLVIAIPPLFLFGEASAASTSRTYYGLMVPASFALTLAIDPLFRRNGRRRLWRGLLAGVLILVAAVLLDALVHRARIEFLVAARTHARLATIENALATGPRNLEVVVIDPQTGIGGVFMLGNLVGSAFRPPFRSVARKVSHVGRPCYRQGGSSRASHH